MERTIGNPDLECDFVDTSLKHRLKEKKSAEFLAQSALYDSVGLEVPKVGNVVSARYTGLTSDNYLFEVAGFKDYVRVDNKQSESKFLNNVSIGEDVDVLISELNEKNYLIKGSVSTLYESRAHINLKSLEGSLEGSNHVLVLVKSLNPAGYDVDVYNGGVTLPGFMPNTLAGINKLVDPTSIVGNTFEVMIESYDERIGTYIVSRRKYLRTLIPNAIKELNSVDVYTGHVTGTTPFGVFVEFEDCLTGMIHKANVHPEWQNKLGDIKPGFQIEFYVKEIIKEKIILTQILRETLWDNIKNGQILDGVVKDTKQFGTLINLDDETVGLIHTSEMEKLNKKFTPGQELKVKVLSVDRTSRKIFLTVG